MLILHGVQAQEILGGVLNNGRWSVSGEFGFNRFDGDLKPTVPELMKGLITSPILGASAEYSLTPLVGIGFGVEGLLFNMEDEDEKYSTGLAHMNTYVTTDLLRIIRGTRHDKFGVWLSGGLGLAGLLRPEYETTRNFVPNQVIAVTNPPVFMTLPFSLGFEYKLDPTKSLALTGKFVFSNTDHMEAIYRGGFADHWQTVSVSYRHKLLAHDNQHFRSENFEYVSPLQRQANALKSELLELTKQLASVQSSVDGLSNRVNDMEDFMSNDGPDSDGDGVPDVRDMEPNTPSGSLVDFWGRAISASEGAGVLLQSVYFDFDSAELDKLAQITIVNVAQKLKDDADLKLEIRGYADNIGAASYNQRLTQRRADRVKNELVKVHGIAPERIIANGRGKVSTPPNAAIVNRRTDFYFSK